MQTLNGWLQAPAGPGPVYPTTLFLYPLYHALSSQATLAFLLTDAQVNQGLSCSFIFAIFAPLSG